jgi:hypothetical protein
MRAKRTENRRHKCKAWIGTLFIWTADFQLMEGREAHGGELGACSFGRHRCCLAPCPGPARVSEASRERIQSAETQVNVILVVAGLEVREFLLVSFEVVPDFNNFRASQFGDLRFSGVEPNAIRQQ